MACQSVSKVHSSMYNSFDKSWDSKSRLSAAAICTASILVIFAADSVLGDTLWGVASRVDCVGSQCLIECSLIGVAVLCLAWSGCLSGRSSRKSTTSVQVRKPTPARAPTVPAVAAPPSSQRVTEKYRSSLEQAAREGKPERAIAVLKDMEKAGLKADSAMPNMVMRAFTNSNDLRGAETWLAEMKTREMEVSVCTYNTIMHGCTKNASKCEWWLSRMVTDGVAPNTVSFTTAIAAHAQAGGEAPAEALLARMKLAGLTPDLICYNALVHASSVCGNIAGVERWLDEMRTQGLEASVNTFTSAIDACAKLGDVRRAEAMMERLLAAGLEPNVVSFSSLMDACAKASDQVRASFWYDRMVEVGVTPNAHSFSSAIHSCVATADAATAEVWLARAQAAGMASDPVIYSGVINVCGKANDADRAWSIFQQMRANGVRPHIVTYAALARPFAHRGDFQRVEEIARIMEEAGVASNEYFLYAHLLSYSSARPKRGDLAEKTFKHALARRVPINDRVIDALGRSVGRDKATALAAAGVAAKPVPWRK